MYSKTPPGFISWAVFENLIWCPHHDSNVELLLRTELFYPLNYGGDAGEINSVYIIYLSEEPRSTAKREMGQPALHYQR